MPLQNRVTPWGEIIAHQARGLFTGNRGVLVDRPYCLARRRWTSQAWLVCAREFRDWWRPVMQPHTWTELFFRDEAVALAAGHRPCATCRRDRFNEFRDRAAATLNMPKLLSPQLDARLHEARMIGRSVPKRIHVARVDEVPDGTFVLLPGDAATACLVWRRRLYPWSPAGYASPLSSFSSGSVAVLTPLLTMNVLGAGYRPDVHPSLRCLATAAR